MNATSSDPTLVLMAELPELFSSIRLDEPGDGFDVCLNFSPTDSRTLANVDRHCIEPLRLRVREWQELLRQNPGEFRDEFASHVALLEQRLLGALVRLYCARNHQGDLPLITETRRN